MKKNIVISPVGLKGREINERMKQLMGMTPINENTTSSKVELTKMGPDGKAYAIVRENHEYYIKTSNKTSGLVMEDFKYIGGLQNKKQEAYPSYAKAIKHLNLRFNSLSEAYNSDMEINTFIDDKLLKEDITGFSQYQGNGFSNEGNMEHNTPMFEEEEISQGTAEEGEIEGISEAEEEDVEMTDEENAIDEMLTNESWMDEELRGHQDRIDMNHNGAIDGQDFHIMRGMEEEMGQEPQKPTLGTATNFDEWITALDDASAKEILHSIYAEIGAPVVNIAKRALGAIGGPEVRDALNRRDGLNEGRLSIENAIEEMDAMIENLNESKKKVKTQ